ncbi:hypothetical protein P8452_11636 [Trifolium repens]|nr:hypothetical protein P8452_11636 [Trifolium repens]
MLLNLNAVFSASFADGFKLGVRCICGVWRYRSLALLASEVLLRLQSLQYELQKNCITFLRASTDLILPMQGQSTARPGIGSIRRNNTS